MANKSVVEVIRKGVVLDISQDGVTHINVYSGGNTELGRSLSNMSKFPTVSDRVVRRTAEDGGEQQFVIGHFNSIEGWWWWLSSGMVNDRLRTCTGFDARRLGLMLPRVPLATFEHEVRYAIALKLTTYPKLLIALTKSTLPLVHYYAYGKSSSQPKIIPADRSMWVIDFLELVRSTQGEALTEYFA